jgi:hypothetical protein
MTMKKYKLYCFLKGCWVDYNDSCVISPRCGTCNEVFDYDEESEEVKKRILESLKEKG